MLLGTQFTHIIGNNMLIHTIISLVIQGLLFLLLADPILGVTASLLWLGREIAAAEYRHIQSLPSRLRKDMPWLGGLYPRYWTIKSLLDWIVPLVVTSLVAILLIL